MGLKIYDLNLPLIIKTVFILCQYKVWQKSDLFLCEHGKEKSARRNWPLTSELGHRKQVCVTGDNICITLYNY